MIKVTTIRECAKRFVVGRSKKKIWLVLAGSVLLLIGFAVGLCAFLRIHRVADIDAYAGMAAECHPIWKEFAFRRFGFGDSAVDMLRRFPPTRREEFGRYGIYSFTMGTSNELDWTVLTVVAREGKLIAAGAGSCTWQFPFFTTVDPELNGQYKNYQAQRRRKLLHMHLEKLEGQLRKFYAQHDRWPTNDPEFYWFVTGQKPPPSANPAENRRKEKAVIENPSATLLGISLKPSDDGSMTIAYIEAPDLKRSVGVPPRHPAQNSAPRE